MRRQPRHFLIHNIFVVLTLIDERGKEAMMICGGDSGGQQVKEGDLVWR